MLKIYYLSLTIWMDKFKSEEHPAKKATLTEGPVLRSTGVVVREYDNEVVSLRAVAGKHPSQEDVFSGEYEKQGVNHQVEMRVVDVVEGPELTSKLREGMEIPFRLFLNQAGVRPRHNSRFSVDVSGLDDSMMPYVVNKSAYDRFRVLSFVVDINLPVDLAVGEKGASLTYSSDSLVLRAFSNVHEGMSRQGAKLGVHGDLEKLNVTVLREDGEFSAQVDYSDPMGRTVIETNGSDVAVSRTFAGAFKVSGRMSPDHKDSVTGKAYGDTDHRLDLVYSLSI
jgi:hypothetical protein